MGANPSPAEQTVAAPLVYNINTIKKNKFNNGGLYHISHLLPHLRVWLSIIIQKAGKLSNKSVGAAD